MATATIDRPQTNDYSHLLNTDHLQGDLKGRSIRGGTAILIGQVAKFLLNVMSTIALARLLTPSDFGLVAMVAPITGFLALFQDLGLSMATIQCRQITHAQVSGLFWINVFVSLVLSLLCIVMAPIVSKFYGDSRLTGITIAMGSLFILGGLTSQHIAILRRQMLFSRLVMLDTFSYLSGVLIAVIAAILGCGYWSLVFMPAGSGLINMLGAWFSTKWKPGLLQRNIGLRPLIAFGGGMTGFSIMNYLARNLDNVLIGQVWGEYSLGIYSRAYSFLILPIQQVNGPISSVATPALSRLQDDPVRFKSYFCKVLRISTFITFPFIVFLILNSRDIIILGFGRQWESMVPIFRILALSAFAQVIGNITGIIYPALGMGKRVLRWGIMGSSWLILSFFVGIPYGVKGVAVAYSSALLIMIVPCIMYAIHATPIHFFDVFKSIANNFIFAALAGIIALIVNSRYFVNGREWINILTSGVIIFIIFIGCHCFAGESYKKTIQDLILNFKSIKL